MSLRHPVVLTTLEEDFRKIGLLQETAPPEEDVEGAEFNEDEAPEESEGQEPEDVEEDVEEEPEEGSDDVEEDVEEDVEGSEDDEAAMAEAVEFNEAFNKEWAALGEAGVDDLALDDNDMADLDKMAEDFAELPAGVVEDEPIGEWPEDEPEGEEQTESASYETVTASLRQMEALLSESENSPEDVIAEAIPAFANVALISEKLHDFFQQVGELDEDEECAEIATSFESIAKLSQQVVNVLQEEDADTIDLETLRETFEEYVSTVLQGMETYAVMNEADEVEEADDDGEGEEQDEGNE